MYSKVNIDFFEHIIYLNTLDNIPQYQPYLLYIIIFILSNNKQIIPYIINN